MSAYASSASGEREHIGKSARMTVEAQVRVPSATMQVVHFDLTEPVDGALRDDESYRLDLSLTPRLRNARACYSAHWAAHRFERIGTLFLVPPGEAVQARSECGRQASLVCRLHPAAVTAHLGEQLEWTEERLAASLDVVDENIRGALLRVVEEMRRPGVASEALVELIAAQLAIELVRYCTSVAERPAPGGLAEWRLRLIEERLTDMREFVSLAELANLCKLSVRQLTRGFRASRGHSIGDYIARKRVDNAMRLLATDRSVKAIAYSLGFASPSSFCYAFHRAVGETPRQFRERASRS